MEEIGRAVERQVRDDAERLLWQSEPRRVTLDDGHVRPAPAEAPRKQRVELDRDHVLRDTRELGGEATRSRAEIDDEVVAVDAGVADELRRERRAEEVLATRPGRTRTACAPVCHGRQRSPSTSRRV